MTACILFVVGALFEYCIIVAMLRFPIDDEKDLDGVPVRERQITKNRLSTAGFIDMFCIVLFTTLFAVFNMNYFIYVNIE